jgi:P2 family phage contractile tail tube protein
MPRTPLITAQFNVFVDGGTRLLGLADVTMPNFEAMTETVTGAGLMGELEVVSRHFSAMTFTMNFRSMLDDALNFAHAQAHNFDLRSAQSFEDNTTYQRGEAAERYSIIGPVKTINHGNRAPNSPWDASLEVAVRRLEHFIDGAQVREIDILNNINRVRGVDLYADIRRAVGG